MKENHVFRIENNLFYFVRSNFFFFYRQIFIQLTVLIAAFMFIILGLPLLICLSSVPIVIIFIYISVYSSYFSKAIELASVSINLNMDLYRLPTNAINGC